MVLYWSVLSCRVTIALSLKKGEGVLSDGFALLLLPILEGVIGIKPRGDTREKESPIRSLGWAFRTQIRTGKGQLFSKI